MNQTEEFTETSTQSQSAEDEFQAVEDNKQPIKEESQLAQDDVYHAENAVKAADSNDQSIVKVAKPQGNFKLTQIILNSALLVLILLTSLLIMFAPIFKVVHPSLKNASENLSALDSLIGLITTGIDKYEDELNNHNSDRSDLEFKRNYKPSNIIAITNVDVFILNWKAKYLENLADRIAENKISAADRPTVIQATNENMCKTLDALLPLYNIFAPEIMRMNYNGLKSFLKEISLDYLANELKEETFKKCEDAHLVFQNYSLQSVTQFFENNSIVDVTAHMPTTFDLYSAEDGEKFKNNELYYRKKCYDYDLARYYEIDGSMGTATLISVALLLISVLHFLMSIIVIKRLVKILKPENVNRAKKKKKSATTENLACFSALILMVLLITLVILLKGATTAFASLAMIIPVLIMLVAILAIEVIYNSLTKKRISKTAEN